ncbi:MAG TPA: hypothetical protein VNA04_16235 [Thermoanaerobaculia bacterium]|nr:hypothetical protein [Thermoanaerobaculia bacterium]
MSRIVIFGLTVSSSWGNGHATLWRALLRSIAGIGHEAVFFERDVPYSASTRDLRDGSGFELVLYRDGPEVVPAARRALQRADAAIITSYCPDAIAAYDLILGQPGITRVFYDLDTPVTLERLQISPDQVVQSSVAALFPAVNPATLGHFTLHARANGDGLFAYGSVIDNASGDPVFVGGR